MEIKFDCTQFRTPNYDDLHIAEVQSDFKINNLYFEKNKKPILPVVGEFHFARFPREQWDDEIKKMKAGGVIAVSTYLMWIYYEEEEGKFDFSGDKDLHYFLEICEKNNMLVILRIGPWIHGEVIYGGFPEFIEKREDKRTSSPLYLQKVRKLYRAYYNECKDFFYQNGSVVIGIQLENEYGGHDKDYIPALRKIAVEEGFLLPLYTITAWPPCVKLNGDLLPTFGRYLERPWTQHTKPLETDNRFKICRERIDKGIGSDILKNVRWDDLPYDIFPYSTCEIGLAIQIYEHRRPILTPEDSFSVGIIQIAQGVNLLGYYVYHGGRNPIGRYQESRSTGYPNNVPISSYDYHTAITEHGYTRESYHRLKLLHYLLADKQAKMALAQPFFSNPIDDEIDYKTSVRMLENGSGYLFINNHQRLDPFKPIENLDVKINSPVGELLFPNINIPTDVSCVFPINMNYGGITIDYATIEPICHDEKDNIKRYFFYAPKGVKSVVKLSNTEETEISANDGTEPVYSVSVDNQKYEYYLLTQEAALNLYNIDNRVFITPDQAIYTDSNGYYADCTAPLADSKKLSLEETEHEAKNCEDYLFSNGEPKEFKLNYKNTILDDCDDIKLEFDLEGNVLQLYCNGVLKADWFNYTGKWVLGLKRFKNEIKNNEDIRIVVSPLDKDHDVYLEYPLKRDIVELSISNQYEINRKYTEF